LPVAILQLDINLTGLSVKSIVVIATNLSGSSVHRPDRDDIPVAIINLNNQSPVGM